MARGNPSPDGWFPKRGKPQKTKTNAKNVDGGHILGKITKKILGIKKKNR